MKIAVVGAGIFGCTAAIYAARAGFEVHLIDRAHTLLTAASAINQYRLHEGYHYPRSPETVSECQAGLRSFRAEYGRAVLDGGLNRYYAIAKAESHVSGEAYLRFCRAHGLPFDEVAPISDDLETMVRVREARLDAGSLRRIAAARLRQAGVHVHYRTPADAALRDRFDQIVVASYAGSNQVAVRLGAAVQMCQFELVEKPVLQLSEKYRDFSAVVMDGPFCSLDPYGTRGLHVMGHVKHAIHATNVGLAAEVPAGFEPYLNRGMVKNPAGTRFQQFIEDGARFLPFLSEAKHLGSMFTVRAVLPNRDATDERLTLVDRLDDQVIRIFSGKIGTAVVAAENALTILGKKRDRTQAAA